MEGRGRPWKVSGRSVEGPVEGRGRPWKVSGRASGRVSGRPRKVSERSVEGPWKAVEGQCKVSARSVEGPWKARGRLWKVRAHPEETVRGGREAKLRGHSRVLLPQIRLIGPVAIPFLVVAPPAARAPMRCRGVRATHPPSAWHAAGHGLRHPHGTQLATASAIRMHAAGGLRLGTQLATASTIRMHAAGHGEDCARLRSHGLKGRVEGRGRQRKAVEGCGRAHGLRRQSSVTSAAVWKT